VHYAYSYVLPTKQGETTHISARDRHTKLVIGINVNNSCWNTRILVFTIMCTQVPGLVLVLV